MHNQNDIVVTPLWNNLGGVTDHQTCADSVCYQTVNKYVKDRTNEHIKWRASMVITVLNISPPHFPGNDICVKIKFYLKHQILFTQLCTAALRLIVRSWLDIPTFATRRLHACHHARARSSGSWNCGPKMSGNFAKMTTSPPFRDLLHAVKLWRGTDSFASPQKVGKPWIFLP